MAEEIRFVSGQMPSLLYATKQIVAASAITRAIHRHERFTEMLYVYQGAGQYIAGGYSYPIRTGDILLYNQGDLHEVTSSLQHEIGTFCFGISGLQLRGLPEGHFTRAENGFVRPAMDEIDHMQALSELIYEHAERRTSYSDEIVSQLLPALVTEAEAAELLSAKSITYRTVGNGSVVTDQLPSAGQEVPGHSEIVLYMGEEKVTEKTTVPNFIGYGVADVNWLANQYGLYIQAKGTDRTDVYVSAAYQDIPEGTEVDKGTTITVEFTTGGASD